MQLLPVDAHYLASVFNYIPRLGTSEMNLAKT